ncbi:MAG TPA: PaaI family thioesterase [Rhizomicrobium sp.]|nr:PaaI family thioesterase [Rhizomicrobium sp.]
MSDTKEPLSAVERTRALIEGRTDYKGIVHTLGFRGVTAEEGFVVMEGTPSPAVYNPMDAVHGGYAATLLDTVMGLAVTTLLEDDQSFTTLELKVAYHRAMTEKTGPVRGEGKVISFGRRAAFTEGRVVDANGKLYATATSTCLVFQR